MILRITEKQAEKVHKLAQDECANFDDGHCLLMDRLEEDQCVQLLSQRSICCRYFENTVLPIDTKLYAKVLEQNAQKNSHTARKAQKGGHHEKN